MIAALYIDPRRGPYASMEGVDAWGLPDRDATLYAGPWPVVAHPPCGHWGRYAHRCHDDGATGPVAVAQVRRWGGVLEQPKDSRLWSACQVPRPGELPDPWGGFSVLVHQRDWGHRADKATWLYIVGVRREDLPPMPPPTPPRQAWTPAKRVLKPSRLESGRPRGARGVVELMGKHERHLTPPTFAEWLVSVANSSKISTGSKPATNAAK